MILWSDQSNHEVDLLIDRGTQLTAIVIKSGRTIQPDFFKGLHYFQSLSPAAEATLIYGGNMPQRRTGISVLTMNELNELM